MLTTGMTNELELVSLTENFHFLSKTATNGLHSKTTCPAEKLLLAVAAASTSPSTPLFSGASRFMIGRDVDG